MWQPRPWAARVVRFALFIAPAMAAWVAVSLVSPAFLELSGWARIPAWIGQALVVSVAAAHLAGVAAKRFVPLPSLLGLTLLFPDEAPSRFGVALRAGTTKKLREQALVLPADEGEAATRALELVTQMNSHDRLTRGHMERVRAHAEVIGKEMGLTEEELNGLRWGTLLHDAGKLRVPSWILQKKGKPTDEEWEILRKHPEHGVAILEPLADFLGPWLGAAADHHERWDGSGYPAGKTGTEISLAGRICCVADAYDVITSNRSYKEKQGTNFAREELVRCSGGQFDPAVVRAFLRAGVRSERRVGGFGWLPELPQILQWSTVATVPTAVSTTAVAVAAVASSTLATAPVTPPEPLAFEEVVEVVVEEPEATTTSTLLSTTVETTLATTAPTIAAPNTEAPTTTVTTIAAPTTTVTTTAVAPNEAATSSTTTSTPLTTTTGVRTGTLRPFTVAAQPIVIPIITTTTTTTATTTTTSIPTRPTLNSSATFVIPVLTTTTTSTTTTSTPTGPATPTGTGFVIRSIAAGDSLEEGNHEFWMPSLIIESGPVTLTDPLELRDFRSPTELPAQPFDTVTIPAGEVVCTYIYHHDPVGVGTRTFSIDFGAEILGLDNPGKGMWAVPQFDIPGVDYGVRNGLESTDSVGVSGSTLTGSSAVRVAVDRVRIFTTCSD